MFHLADDSTPYRVIGIDPGTDTLGAAGLDIDLHTGKFTLVDAHTLHASRMLKYYRDTELVHGSRFARLHGLELALGEYFEDMQPHSIISESPYMGQRATPFAALTECLTSIRRAVRAYNGRLPLLEVDPARAKARIGVSGKSGDKSLMQAAVIGLSDIQNPYGVDLQILDEHSIDAIAIAYFRACDLRSQLLL